MTDYLDDIATYVSGEDTSELAKVKAELAYALSALDREMAILGAVDAKNKALIEALRPFAWYFDLNDCKDRSESDALEVPIRDLRIAFELFEAMGLPITPIRAPVGDAPKP